LKKQHHNNTLLQGYVMQRRGQWQTSAIRIVAVGFNNVDGYSGFSRLA